MSAPLDDRYFEWLYSQVGAVRNRNPAQSYWTLARQMFTKEYLWFVPNDDNRVNDGKALRWDFIDEQEIDQVDTAWVDLDCSMLEMLVALARRASFESEKAPDEWFWIFITNLGFAELHDAHFLDEHIPFVDDILERINRRTYASDGQGGLFPLRDPSRDQRKVELWYQMSAYLIENFPT